MRHQGRYTVWVLVCLALIVGAAAHPSTVPVASSTCDAIALGASVPAGIAYDAALDQFVIIDASESIAFRTDRECNATSSFDLTALGAAGAQGVAVNSTDRTYAFVAPNRQLVFATDAGIALGSCNLLPALVLRPVGIDYDPVRDAYVVLDASDDEIVFIASGVTDGSACPVLGRGVVERLGDFPRDGLALLPEGRIALVERQADRVVLVDTALEIVDSFFVNFEVGVSVPVAITYVPDAQRLYLLDMALELVEVDIRGQSTRRCDLAELYPDLNARAGLALDASRSQLLVGDDGSSSVWALDADTCELVEILSLASAGLDTLDAIAYDASRDQIIVGQLAGRQLAFVDRQLLTLRARCTLATNGVPTAVVPLEAFGWFAIADTVSEVSVLDRRCELIESNGVGFFGVFTADALTYGPLGEVLFFGDARGGITTLEGSDDRFRFDVPFDASVREASGVLPLPGERGKYLALIRSSNDPSGFAVNELDIPLFAEPVSVAGTFSNGSLTLALIARPDDTVTGRLSAGVQSTTVIGFVDPQAGTIGLSFRPFSGGDALSINGTVSSDLEVLELSAPLGTMVRQP